MAKAVFDRRPIIVAIAGPNGAGKSTFYVSQIAAAGLPFLNADNLAVELALDAYHAAQVNDALRRQMIQAGESFVFETVFSDPVGDKLKLLSDAADAGYQVVLCFIGLSSVELSGERVAMRVSRGGHDVPDEKITARFPRTLSNLKSAIERLPYVLVFDNSDLLRPFRQVATFEQGKLSELSPPVPAWLQAMMPVADK